MTNSNRSLDQRNVSDSSGSWWERLKFLPLTDHAAQYGHRHQCLYQRTVAELAVGVVAPAARGRVPKYGARVAVTSRDGNDVGDPDHGHRLRREVLRSIA